ncbi:MAG: SWIM zinc finger family protein [Motiliproteus sp.]
MAVSSKFSDLSWNELHQWAGETIVARGKNYQTRVSDLCMFSERYLLARVRGQDDYETLLWIDDAGELQSRCSCPYSWGPCKHSVATLLVYNDLLRSGKPVAAAEASDPRLALLQSVEADSDMDAETRNATDLQSRLETRLLSLDKTELVALLLETAQRHSAVEEFLALQLMAADDNMQPVISQLERDIRKTLQQRGWQNYWDGEGFTPDYSSIEERLSLLLDRGCYESVIELGEQLFRQGIEQIADSQDEGETLMAIAECFPVVILAMANSGRSAVERMLWFWELQRQDDYGLLSDIEEMPVDEDELTVGDWGQIARHYQVQLDEMQKPTTKPSQRGLDWSSQYQRSNLLEYATRAWAAAKEPGRVTGLLTADLPYTQCYPELVDHLLTLGAVTEARDWAYRGIQDTQQGSPGVASRLLERLLKMAEQEGDFALAAAYRVIAFIDAPSLSIWDAVKRAADQVAHWPAVRVALLAWLESGKLPANQDDWPLPDPDLPPLESSRVRWWKCPDRFPCHADLIAIALHEQQIDAAVGWYQQQPVPRSHSLALAEAATGRYPELSLQIWEQTIMALIAEVKPKAYRQAKPFMIKMRTLMNGGGRSGEFGVFIGKLRQVHKPKRRLMEVLDEVEFDTLNKRLGDG